MSRWVKFTLVAFSSIFVEYLFIEWCIDKARNMARQDG